MEVKFLKDGQVHKVDQGRNHFIDGKCVNVKQFELDSIGDTIPEYAQEDVIVGEVVVYGFVPHTFDEDGKFVRL